jgi:hypothetical protein
VKFMDLFQIFDQFQSCPLLISSSPRGGSTFSKNAVGIHPNILRVNWNDKTLSKIWPKRKLPHPEFRSLVLREPDYFNRDKALAYLGVRGLNSLEALIDGVCKRRRLGELFCLHGFLYWLMVEPEFKLDSMHYWVVKTNTLENLYKIGNELPRLRFVMVQRDPRPVSLSLAKVYAGRGRFSTEHIVKGSVDWARQAARCSKFLANMEERAIGIRYEDLVLDNQATLNEVYNFLNLKKLEPNLIEQSMGKVYFKRTGSVYDKPFDKDNPRPTGIQLEGLERWKQQLSEGQKQIIGSLSSHPARYFGYEVNQTKNPPFLGGFFSITAPIEGVKQLIRWISSILIIWRVRRRGESRNLLISTAANEELR